MLDHVKVGVADLEAAKAYYTNALAPLGYRIVFEAEEMAYFADAARLDFGVGPSERPGDTHVCFKADDAAVVDAFYQAALAAGGTDNGPPGLRSEYAEDYYAAYVLDPDGNNIEAMCHRAG